MSADHESPQSRLIFAGLTRAVFADLSEYQQADKGQDRSQEERRAGEIERFVGLGKAIKSLGH